MKQLREEYELRSKNSSDLSFIKLPIQRDDRAISSSRLRDEVSTKSKMNSNNPNVLGSILQLYADLLLDMQSLLMATSNMPDCTNPISSHLCVSKDQKSKSTEQNISTLERMNHLINLLLVRCLSLSTVA
jgi:hypothetical protein